MSPAKKSSRRDFLLGQAAADAATDWIDRVGEESAGESAPGSDATAGDTSDQPPRYLLQVERQVMACDFQVILNAGQPPRGADVAMEVLDLTEQLEQQMTVYRNTSEVAEINALAGRRAVIVEPRLYGLLKQAVALYHETQGAFDITSGPLSNLWGFTRREGRIPNDEQLAESLARVGSDKLILNDAARSIRFAVEGMEINLGGIGKGYALDRAGEALEDEEVSSFLIHGGQSSVLARGHRYNTPEQGWTLGLRDPLRHDRRLLEIHLHHQALGTSGSGTQSFQHQGRRYGHILDPRTGRPAEGVLSSTVLAPRAALADALATAFYVLGVDAAEEYCQRHADTSAIVLTPDASQRGYAMHVFGLAKDRYREVDSRLP